MDPIIIKNNDILGSIKLYPSIQLLFIKVNISSWNLYKSGSEWSEEEVIKTIFKLLKN
jgi:hypothetical protein